MKNVDASGSSDLGTQLTLGFEAADCRDQSFLPVPQIIVSAKAVSLRECNVVAFPRHRISAADAGLIARILQRTRNFV
ncbi:hypothetical protein [Pseudomonas syringae]|uniref:hypothetical protein n=1 Tax=Pseudomonas syringae TaxID=317 RepID=UPI001F1A96F7|nr:hypothetical protein [Pseudomonas syringae]MCF5222992.1 hypothetical protein [Pseudomonas syringae]MCF5242084.1 hypothetical protein [Pseudomonas syringae]